ncbi:MAG TPA: hypothetical protein VGR94_05035 [Candidatus Acidoferrales bacterium]|nr:hypothetical protein [Candidatus Acidoferrales bacterium]
MDELLNVAEEKPKRGRRTTADNFLLGARNSWLYFFEGFWHDIGWSLLQVRERGNSSIDEIRSVFEPVRAKGNGQLANCFLRGSPQSSEGEERRSNRKRLSGLHIEIQRMQGERQELETNCGYAETALKDVHEQYRDAIEAELEEKGRRLLELTQKLQSAEDESKHLEETICNQESYFYCSQVLDFLYKGKYAVKPLPLANSLAGLPGIGWRQSLARCSKMPRGSSHVQYPYGIWEAILKIWKCHSTNPQLSVIDLFRAKIPKLLKKNGEARTYLSEGWRDLRMAIEQCSKEACSDGFMPYAITGAFVRNRSRPKSHAEQILEQREKLT